MTITARRETLRLALVAATAPMLFVAMPAWSQAAGRPIAPPAGPMRYSRSVSRDLADGLLFTVARDFDVAFRPHVDGFMLEGAQVDARVDCPDALAEFARIESARDESAMFPIALSQFGEIMSPHIGRPAGQDIRESVDEALSILAGQPIGSDEREQLSRFVAALQDAGRRVTAHLPADLFAPAHNSRREAQDIPLPGGADGRIEITFESRSDPESGLMRSAERTIAMHVADTTRTTREQWELVAI